MTEPTRNVCNGCSVKQCKWCKVSDPYLGFVCTIDSLGYGNCPDKNCTGLVFQCMNLDTLALDEFKSCYMCKYIPVNFSTKDNSE